MFGQQNEPVTLKRDLDATAVPAGIARASSRRIRSSTSRRPWEAAFTIYFEGNLYRVAGKDAEALGREPAAIPELRPGATDADFEQLVWDQMRTVYDPEIPINIVELGLVYECRIQKGPQRPA